MSQAADFGGYLSGPASRAGLPPVGVSDGSALVQVPLLLMCCFASRGFHGAPAAGAHDTRYYAPRSVTLAAAALAYELTAPLSATESLSASAEQARVAEVKCEKLQVEAEELRRTHDAHVKQSKSVATQACILLQQWPTLNQSDLLR